MNLTEHEQAIYDGNAGEARKFAIRLLTSIGELYSAPRLVPVRAAAFNSPGSESGRNGWEQLVRYYAGRRMKTTIPTFADPDMPLSSRFINGKNGLFDTDDGSLKEFSRQKKDLMSHYTKLGANRYRIYPATRRKVELEGRNHMAVSDPATAVFLNSRYSIRTNAESPAVALASAILGRTTLSGMHMIEKRVPDVLVRVHADLSPGDFALMGLYYGDKYRTSLPYFKLKDWNYIPSERELFEFSSALSFTGNIPMFHIQDFTPENHLYRPTSINRKVKVKDADIEKIRRKYSPSDVPDLVVVGAPYASFGELREAAGLFSGVKQGRRPHLAVFTTGEIQKLARESGVIKKLDVPGVTIFADSRFTDLPLGAFRAQRVLTDSTGCLEINKNHKKKGVRVELASTGMCLEVAAKGVLTG